MSAGPAGPLSRPFPVGRVSTGGVDAEVVATPQECDALARELGLPAIHALRGRYRLTGSGRRIRMTGRLTAEIEQVCVVSLEPFLSGIDEDVEVEFEEPRPERARPEADDEHEVEADLDRPDELVGDKLDLGAITAEFLALGLDPYPKKPGATFALPDEQVAGISPFAGLSVLKGGRPEPE